MNNWIIAPVVLPAMLAPVMVMAMRHDLTLQRIFSLAGSALLGLIAIGLLIAAASGPVETYQLGNWPAPFGIVLVLDRLSALMLVLTNLLALVVALYAIGSGWDARGRHFHPLLQFQLMGLNGAFLTGDAFNLFVFFEVLLIASYGLMIHGGGADRLKAGVQYVVFNLAGSALFLFALGTLYSTTGTLNMADLAQKVATLPPGDAALVRVGAVLLLMVFAVKAALVPLQFWLPNTYSNAPGPVAALFAVMTKVGAYAVLRLFTLIFPPGTPATGTLFADLLLPAALLSLVVGTLGVLGARQLTRMIAFSAIASMGTLFAVVALFDTTSATAALYYMLHSTLATAALFLIADLVIARRGAAGGQLRAAAPIAQGGLIATLFFVAAIAMTGMPPLSGFIGKLFVLEATQSSPHMALIWTTILATSLAAIIGFARAGSSLFWKSATVAPGESAGEPKTPALPFVAVASLLAALVLLTLFAGPVGRFLAATSTQLHDRAGYIADVLHPRKESQ